MILVLKSLQYAGTVNRHNVCKLSRPSSSGSKKKRKEKKKKKEKENKQKKEKNILFGNLLPGYFNGI